MSYCIKDKLKRFDPHTPKEGSYPVRLDANESFLPLPHDALTRFYKELPSFSFNRYPDPAAKKLCNAFANKFGISPSRVTAGNGSDELISLIFQIFLPENGKVITFTPDFSMYKFYANLRGATQISIPRKEDFSVDILLAAHTANSEDADIIIFTSPNNPSGKTLPIDDIKSLLACNCLVVIDEAYMDFSDKTFLHESEKYDNLIILRTMSKLYAAAALRIGFAVANEDITRVLQAAKSPFNVSGISQLLGTLLLQSEGFAEYSMEQINRNRGILLQDLRSLKTVLGADFTPLESEANFIFIHTEKAKEIYNRLLEDGVVIRILSGKAVRVTIGTEEENERVIELLRSYK